jgi:hypothetical protein
MPRGEVLGRRETEGMASAEELASSEREGMPLEVELAELDVLSGWREEKGMRFEERGIRHEELLG